MRKRSKRAFPSPEAIPKMINYKPNGGGRDCYIYKTHGGFVSPEKKTSPFSGVSSD